MLIAHVRQCELGTPIIALHAVMIQKSVSLLSEACRTRQGNIQGMGLRLGDLLADGNQLTVSSVIILPNRRGDAGHIRLHGPLEVNRQAVLPESALRGRD